MIKNPLLNIFFFFFLCFQIFFPGISNADFLNHEQLPIESYVRIFLPLDIHNGVFDKFFSFFTHNFFKLHDSGFISINLISGKSEPIPNESDNQNPDYFIPIRNNDFIVKEDDKKYEKAISDHWLIIGLSFVCFIFVFGDCLEFIFYCCFIVFDYVHYRFYKFKTQQILNGSIIL